jgi:hypothetical protein
MESFLQALQSSYQLPCCAAIGGNLMRAEYVNTMCDVLTVLGTKHQLICFKLDGATNLQGKQIINMIPNAFFLEHFTMELRIESAANLLEKLLNCKLRAIVNFNTRTSSRLHTFKNAGCSS